MSVSNNNKDCLGRRWGKVASMDLFTDLYSKLIPRISAYGSMQRGKICAGFTLREYLKDHTSLKTDLKLVEVL